MRILLDGEFTFFFRAALASRATSGVHPHLRRLYFVDNEIVASDGHLLFWFRHNGDAVPEGLLVDVDSLSLPDRVCNVELAISDIGDLISLTGSDLKYTPNFWANLPCVQGAYVDYQKVLDSQLSPHDAVHPVEISTQRIARVEEAIGAVFTRFEVVGDTPVYRLHFGGAAYLEEDSYRCMLVGSWA